jgi:hypothetical protein
VSSKQKRDKEWLDRELERLIALQERLIALQREGAFGPMLDTGGYVPFSFVAELLKLEKQIGEWVN